MAIPRLREAPGIWWISAIGTVVAVFWQWNISIHAFNVSPGSKRAAHLSGPPMPALKASSHNERIFVNKIYGHWTLPYRVLPPGARERSVEVSSFILAWNAIKVRRLGRIVLLRFGLRSAVLCCGLIFLSSLLLPLSLPHIIIQLIW